MIEITTENYLGESVVMSVQTVLFSKNTKLSRDETLELSTLEIVKGFDVNIGDTVWASMSSFSIALSIMLHLHNPLNFNVAVNKVALKLELNDWEGAGCVCACASVPVWGLVEW